MKEKIPPTIAIIQFGVTVIAYYFGEHWATLLASLGLVVSLGWWYRSFRHLDAARPSAPEEPSQQTKPEPPTERAYVPDTLTPYELWKLVSNKTDAVASLEAGRYIGAWLPVPQAKLINVEQEQNRQMAALVEVGGPMVITLRCYFDAKRWRSALLFYDPGQPIAFNGRIVAFQNPLRAYEPHIILEDCEL